ncbi:MAG: NifB/NifX family molybdenum-iron cluster-binding protein [Gammaproteobacteria bacterium]|jgi:hypothetical protein
MKVAVLSSDRINVDGHFGKTERFLIYELEADGPRLVEERACRPVYGEKTPPYLEFTGFDDLLHTLVDCQKIFISHIGRTPAARLRVSGIEPVIYAGPIARISPQ